MSPEYRCQLFIQPKEGINDPEGDMIKWALGQLGHAEIIRFKSGREFTFILTAQNIAEARRTVGKMARAPLQKMANPVTEVYQAKVKWFKKGL